MKIHRFLVDVHQPQNFIDEVRNRWPQVSVMDLGAHCGDVFVQLESGKKVAIEYKAPNDLLSSIADRRLFEQAVGIRKVTPFAFLLIGGDLKYNGENKIVAKRGGYQVTAWTRDMVEGALTRVQASGVIVRFAYQGVPEAIDKILEWVDKCDTGQVTREVITLNPFNEQQQLAVNYLTLFDGIGLVKAKHFVEWARTTDLWEIILLSQKEFIGLDRPKSWSNADILRIRNQLRLRAGKYLTEMRKTEWLEEL